MPALQTRIAAFESLAGGATSHKALNAVDDDQPTPSSFIDAPLPAATAASLPPPVVITPTKPSPSPSPPNLGRKTSLIDMDDWMLDDDRPRTSSTNNPGLLINLDTSSPPKPKVPPSPSRKPAPPLPPRKASHTSLKSVASSSSSQSSNAPQAFLYPPRPRPDGGMPLTVNTMELLNHGGQSRHTQGSSISSFHSVSLSSDTDPSTPGSISNFIQTYPVESSDSLGESFEDVSASSISPATERMITLDFEKARARAANRSSSQTIILPSANLYSPSGSAPPKLPQRPSPPNSTRSSLRSPPPLPSRSANQMTSGSSTPRSTPTSPIVTPLSTPMIPTTYAVRRAPPPPPSRSSYASASDRSSIHSTFSFSSSGHSQASRVTAFNGASGPINPLTAAAHTKRPTPVPLAARKRYEKVFTSNVLQRRKAVMEQQAARRKSQEEEEQRKRANGFLSPDSISNASPTSPGGRARRAAGWRGLSVDLITGDPDSVADQLNQKVSVGQKDKGKARENSDSDSDEDGDLVKVRSQQFKETNKENEETVGKDERLEGVVIKLIWKRSGLEKRRLAEIWNECDPMQIGSLDVDGFVKGMWRIDEELRRAQTQLLKSANTPGALNSRSNSANSSRTSLLSSRHNSFASINSNRSAVPASLSRQSSTTSQRSTTTMGSRNAAYQKLTGANPPPSMSNTPPPSAYNTYSGRGAMSGHRGGPGGYNGYTGSPAYGAGYSTYGNGGGGGLSMKSLLNNGSAQLGSLNVTVPSVVRNILRGS